MSKTKNAAILGVVNSILALLLAYGVDVSTDQQVAITGLVNAVLILVVAWRDPGVPFGKQD